LTFLPQRMGVARACGKEMLAFRPYAVALDLDGTTLDDRHELAPRTKRAVADALEKGIKVIIATGRPSYSTQRYVDALDAAVVAVTFNGAGAAELRPRKPPRRVFQTFLDVHRAATAVEAALALGCCASLVLPDRAVAVAPTAKQRKMLEKFVALEGSPQEIVEDWAPYRRETVKVLGLCDDPAATAKHARKALGRHSGIVVVAAEVHVEFLAEGVNKAAALRELLSEPELARTVAFGDSFNDVEMLACCGVGVAMANAKDEAKASADRVSAYTNDDDAVARELELLTALPELGTVAFLGRRFKAGAALRAAAGCVAGGLAAAADATAAAPLKRLVTVAQTSRTPPPGFPSSFRTLYAAEGARAFWAGHLTQCAKSFAKQVARSAKQALAEADGARSKARPWRLSLGADLAAAAASCALAPLDASHCCHAASPPVAASLVQIWRAFGARGLYAGLGLKVAGYALALPARALAWRAAAAARRRARRKLPRGAAPLVTFFVGQAVAAAGDVAAHPPVWNSTTGLGGPDQTSEFSSSIKSKSIRLIFGRIDCSRRVLEAQPKSLRRNCRICAH